MRYRLPTLLMAILLINMANLFSSCSSSDTNRHNANDTNIHGFIDNNISNNDIVDDDIIEDDDEYFSNQPNIEGEWHRIISGDASQLLKRDRYDTINGEMIGEETYSFDDEGSFSCILDIKVDARDILKTNDAFLDLIFMSNPMEITFSINCELFGTYVYDEEAENLLLTQTDLEIYLIEFNTNYGLVNSLMKENAEKQMEKKIYNILPNGKTYDYEVTLCTEKQLWLQDDEENAKYVRVTY